MRFSKSNLVTIAAAGLIVALSGGTGAYAATQIAGDSVKDNTLDSTEVQNGSLTGTDVDNGTLTGLDLRNNTVQSVDVEDGTIGSADLKDNSVQYEDLGASTTDGILEDLKADGQVDSNGTLNQVNPYPTNGAYDNLPMENGPYLVSVAVTDATQAVQVVVTVGDQDFTCVAAPTAGFDGTCSVTGFTSGGQVSVTGENGATVEVNAVQG